MDDDAADFRDTLMAAAEPVEITLGELLPDPEDTVTEAMRYATLGGGKRLRAFLVVETSNLFRVPLLQSARAAAAVECIHAYSLIHDDLPAMDDDDLRRGKPTVHKKWDEATAILAGDALQALAFEILAAPQTALDAALRTKLVSSLAKASGAAGMVRGQALDMVLAETKGATVEQIEKMQSLKTGALIRWCVEAGAILGKSDASNLLHYADALGLAFQIQDDVLDVVGNEKETGKAVGKDQAAGKATFVTLLGLETAKEKARDLVSTACDSLEPYGSAAEPLRQAARFVIERTS